MVTRIDTVTVCVIYTVYLPEIVANFYSITWQVLKACDLSASAKLSSVMSPYSVLFVTTPQSLMIHGIIETKRKATANQIGSPTLRNYICHV